MRLLGGIPDSKASCFAPPDVGQLNHPGASLDAKTNHEVRANHRAIHQPYSQKRTELALSAGVGHTEHSRLAPTPLVFVRRIYPNGNAVARRIRKHPSSYLARSKHCTNFSRESRTERVHYLLFTICLQTIFAVVHRYPCFQDGMCIAPLLAPPDLTGFSETYTKKKRACQPPLPCGPASNDPLCLPFVQPKIPMPSNVREYEKKIGSSLSSVCGTTS